MFKIYFLFSFKKRGDQLKLKKIIKKLRKKKEKITVGLRQRREGERPRCCSEPPECRNSTPPFPDLPTPFFKIFFSFNFFKALRNGWFFFPLLNFLRVFLKLEIVMLSSYLYEEESLLASLEKLLFFLLFIIFIFSVKANEN